MGQEIKIRSNPGKSGQIRAKPVKSGQIRAKPVKSGQIRTNPDKSRNPKNPSQKIFHFLKDFHSLTPAGVPFPLEQSLILLGRIHALGHLSNNKELVHFHSQPMTKY